MGSQSRWGLTLPLHGLPVAEQRDLVASLPDLGYTDVWSAELNGVDAFTPLALASQWAPQLRLGTAIVGVYGRAPVTLAVQAATLADLAPGKFVMGIGTSSQVAVEQWDWRAQPWLRLTGGGALGLVRDRHGDVHLPALPPLLPPPDRPAGTSPGRGLDSLDPASVNVYFDFGPGAPYQWRRRTRPW